MRYVFCRLDLLARTNACIDVEMLNHPEDSQKNTISRCYPSPFLLTSHNQNATAAGIKESLLFPLVEKMLGLDTLDSIWQLAASKSEVVDLVSKSLDLIGVDYSLSQKDGDRIPGSGPTVVVCDHPFGGIAGLIIADLLLSIRNDVYILVN